jgi:1,4-alpha-glucan branching enzyme
MGIKKKYSTSKTECKVTFKVPKNLAGSFKKINLVGDFNSWNQKAQTMTKLKSGDFSITIDLESGREYQFRYLADKTEWLNDDSPDRLVTNEFQGQNSVVAV